MFQIAAAIAYALEHGCEARFPDLIHAKDAEENCKFIFHRLNLNPFPENTPFEILNGPIGEHTFAPLPYFPDKNVSLSGFFQSEHYFLAHENVIRDLFAPTQEILDEIDAKYGELLKGPTVAVHVRTFIKDGWDPHATFRPGYYLLAMNHFSPEHHFLVFSDNMDWTRRHFLKFGKKVTFIEGNPSHIDFYLMSLCDHQIVSYHSTFSWWAAWLNKNPNKIVVAADPRKRTGVKDDFIPNGWIKY